MVVPATPLHFAETHETTTCSATQSDHGIPELPTSKTRMSEKVFLVYASHRLNSRHSLEVEKSHQTGW